MPMSLLLLVFICSSMVVAVLGQQGPYVWQATFNDQTGCSLPTVYQYVQTNNTCQPVGDGTYQRTWCTIGSPSTLFTTTKCLDTNCTVGCKVFSGPMGQCSTGTASYCSSTNPFPNPPVTIVTTLTACPSISNPNPYILTATYSTGICQNFSRAIIAGCQGSSYIALDFSQNLPRVPQCNGNPIVHTIPVTVGLCQSGTGIAPNILTYCAQISSGSSILMTLWTGSSFLILTAFWVLVLASSKIC